MYLCLFEDDHVRHLEPLVLTRGVYGLRLGRRTLLETTHEAFGTPSLLLHTRAYLAGVVRQEHDALVNRIPEGLGVLFVNGRYVAEDGDLLERLKAVAQPNEPGRVFVQDDVVIAAWVPEAASRFVEADAVTRATFDGVPEEVVSGARLIGRLWDLLDELPRALARDFTARSHGYNILERPGATVHERATLVEADHVYVAPGAQVKAGAIVSAEDGPVYVDADAVVMENAVVHGPAYIGPKAQVKVGAHVGGSAIGTYCKVGGEVKDSVFHSYSNKGHAGYVGDSYLGRWCNLGADTNTSNLKNDYGLVTAYDAAEGNFVSTGRQFAGLFMGDHSKSSINTMFNTGTVIGVSCNLYGGGFPPRHVPSFSWGGADAGLVEYRLEKALRVAEAVMARRGHPLTDADRTMLTRIFEQTHAS